MDELIYMDHNATTPVDRRVKKAMLPYHAEYFGNPSSLYSLSEKSRKAISNARKEVAELIGAEETEIIFTSGGTESINFAIKGLAFKRREKGNHIVTSRIEHSAVLNSCRWLEKEGFRISYVGVDEHGVIKLDELEKSITGNTILITIMHANNEVGTIQPVKDVSKIARKYEIPFHTDAVQSVGKIELDVNEIKVDLLSLSGHKFYGPKGVGALYLREGMELDNFMHGGSQEMGKRAGTENLPGIVGLGKASEIAIMEMEKEERVKFLRDELEKKILENIQDVKINGHPEKKLPGTLHLCFRGVDSNTLLFHLNKKNILASSGSACHSGSPEPSHVMSAMGISPELSRGTVRFSPGRENTEEEIDRVVEVVEEAVKKLKKGQE